MFWIGIPFLQGTEGLLGMQLVGLNLCLNHCEQTYFLSLAAFWVFSVPSVLSLQGLHLDAAFILPITLNIY